MQRKIIEGFTNILFLKNALTYFNSLLYNQQSNKKNQRESEITEFVMMNMDNSKAKDSTIF